MSDSVQLNGPRTEGSPLITHLPLAPCPVLSCHLCCVVWEALVQLGRHYAVPSRNDIPLSVADLLSYAAVWRPIVTTQVW